jgi:hypothetical protein
MKINNFNDINKQTVKNNKPAGGADFAGFFEQFQNHVNGGLKCLIKDSMALNTNEIKNEIDRITNCETGEKIDMIQLNELLKLYNNF